MRVPRDPRYNRTARKLLHMLGAVGAVALPFIPYYAALAWAVAGVVVSYLLKPKHHRWLELLSKPADREAQVITGLRGYMITLLLLILAWPVLQRWDENAVYYVMFGWLALALGDGLAGMVGPSPGETPTVPWNKTKTWLGSLGCALGVAAAYAGCFYWPLLHAGGQPLGLFALGMGVLGVLTALVESLDLPVDDNLTVGLGAPLMAVILHLLIY
jgi:dolichol kinase